MGSSSNSINAVAANLAQLERESVDIDVALQNEKPTVLEPRGLVRSVQIERSVRV